jgi:hypothetical protein
VTEQSRRALLRLGLLFGAIPIALPIGLVLDSANAFIVVMAVALVVSVVLGLTVLR